MQMGPTATLCRVFFQAGFVEGEIYGKEEATKEIKKA